MPIFEYNCKKCGSNFEELVRSGTIENSIQCSTCGSRQIQRIMSIIGLVAPGNQPSGQKTASSGCNSCSSHNCANCRWWVV